MAFLLQEMTEPIENNLLLLIAVPLAIIQALMIYFSQTGKIKVIRLVNMIIALVFGLFNVGFIIDAQVG